MPQDINKEPWQLPEAGSFNVAPANMREITADEFCKVFFHYCIEKEEFRQIHRQNDGTPIQELAGWDSQVYMTARLFWFQDGSGIAMTEDYGKHGEELEKTWGKYTHKLQLWRFSVCDHKYREVDHEFAQKVLGIQTWGMFCHVYYCPECGRSHTTDRSG